MTRRAFRDRTAHRAVAHTKTSSSTWLRARFVSPPQSQKPASSSRCRTPSRRWPESRRRRSRRTPKHGVHPIPKRRAGAREVLSGERNRGHDRCARTMEERTHGRDRASPRTGKTAIRRRDLFWETDLYTWNARMKARTHRILAHVCQKCFFQTSKIRLPASLAGETESHFLTTATQVRTLRNVFSINHLWINRPLFARNRPAMRFYETSKIRPPASLAGETESHFLRSRQDRGRGPAG